MKEKKIPWWVWALVGVVVVGGLIVASPVGLTPKIGTS